MSPVALDRRGLWIAVGAFVIWGLMPLYWHLLKAVPSLQIVLHRAVWCAVLVAAWLTLREGRGWFAAVAAQPRLAGMLALSGALIAANWGLYVWAVNAGHVVEASLGYFINPLLNVVIGVLFLRERLSPAQWVAVALAGCGVLWLTFHYGSFPWIALCLACSFALYGVIRKFAAVEAVRGLGVENMFMFVPALALLLWFELQGQGGFFSLRWGGWIDALLVLGGALTAVPLIFFAYAVRRVPLSVVGLLQYIGPTLQLLLGVFFFGEAFGSDRAIGFGFIWIGLAAFAIDGALAHRRRVVAQQA
ncbi:EamA family transporter RarD [Luteimonas kalidii]|uniref:EamA family transporter RarD n=1 Tax=Luteimonas kalidii TaxID=3042025 RepID=A0ABT6JX76_9GAMM|nr:EamA family transporter RarD [Luteimonas kalidii]MDH5835297.1 EamA family transporter RarD [Luteimonas kalidii]